MTKKSEPLRQFVILDASRDRFERYLSGTVSFCNSLAQIGEIYDRDSASRTWVTFTQKFTDDLLKAAARHRTAHRKLALPRRDCVLTIASPRPESVPTLHGLFARVVGESPGYHWLPKEELAEVLFDATAGDADLFIAAAADPITRTLSLVRGDCRQVVVPFSIFDPSGDGTRPDFGKIRVTDFGRTIALGDYEAAADAILYETDADYRKKMNLQRKANERSFGASLFRLRKQRKLRRTDFPELSAKTIARIERNEIGRPHGATLKIIADRLSVPANEIGNY